MDVSTDKVMDWLNCFGKVVLRINSTDFQEFVKNVSISNESSTIHFFFRGLSFTEEDIEAVWFRRHAYTFNQNDSEIDLIDGNSSYNLKGTNYEVVSQNLQQEFNTVRDYVFYRLQKKTIVLGHWKENHENKLKVLDLAVKFGLNIPSSKVITRVKELNEEFDKSSKLITKSLSYAPGIFLEELKTPISSFTTKLSDFKDKVKSEHFFWSLVQKEIEKEIEIRVFYLNGNCYSMAIFSQSSKETSTDFRNYDTNRPNRTVPYQLPEDIEDKLILLMNELQLNTGSIDLLLDKNDNYIFLEINPVGQFGMVSMPCNYFLEKRIAEYLSNHASK